MRFRSVPVVLAVAGLLLTGCTNGEGTETPSPSRELPTVSGAVVPLPPPPSPVT